MRRNLFSLARVENATVHVRDLIPFLFLSRSGNCTITSVTICTGLVLGLVVLVSVSHFRRWEKDRHRVLEAGNDDYDDKRYVMLCLLK